MNTGVPDPLRAIKLLLLIATYAATQRGGRILVPRSEIQGLQRLELALFQRGDEYVLQLIGSRQGVRHAGTYGDRSVYRLALVLKYVIVQTPEKVLRVLGRDLSSLNARMTFGPCAEGVFAQIEPPSVHAGPGDRLIDVQGNRFLVLDADGERPTRLN